jgi:hypothetical protein
MFNPTRDQARQFFIDTWARYRLGQPLEGAQTQAIAVILDHSEYHALLDDPETALARDWMPGDGQLNPFLHMSLHLAILEQLSVDQPPGVRERFDALLARRGDRHAALHDMLECLGEMLWQAQRSNTAPDAHAYLACLGARS